MCIWVFNLFSSTVSLHMPGAKEVVLLPLGQCFFPITAVWVLCAAAYAMHPVPTAFAALRPYTVQFVGFWPKFYFAYGTNIATLLDNIDGSRDAKSSGWSGDRLHFVYEWSLCPSGGWGNSTVVSVSVYQAGGPGSLPARSACHRKGEILSLCYWLTPTSADDWFKKGSPCVIMSV